MGPTDVLVLTVGNSVFYAAIGMVAAMAWTSIVKAVELSRRASEELAESDAELLAAQEAAAASNRWDSVIHDHAVNALRAAEKALANVSRHSGVSAASVTGRFSPSHAELVVRDEGSGFDPARVPEGRHGLQGSIIGAMETRGGWARIESSPGLGTTVALGWDAPGTGTVRLARLGSFRAMVVFLVLTAALSLSLGWVEHGAVVGVELRSGYRPYSSVRPSPPFCGVH